LPGVPRPCIEGQRRAAAKVPGQFCRDERATSRLLNSAIRASCVAISASFSPLDNEEESNGAVTHTLTHIARRNANALFESSCRTSALLIVQ
jgi:hypothetical protein